MSVVPTFIESHKLAYIFSVIASVVCNLSHFNAFAGHQTPCIYIRARYTLITFLNLKSTFCLDLLIYTRVVSVYAIYKTFIKQTFQDKKRDGNYTFLLRSSDIIITYLNVNFSFLYKSAQLNRKGRNKGREK